MTTTVQIPVSLGGTNVPYNDGTGAYGMASNNGYGHTQYFFPMVSEVMAAMATRLTQASTAGAAAGAAAAEPFADAASDSADESAASAAAALASQNAAAASAVLTAADRVQTGIDAATATAQAADAATSRNAIDNRIYPSATTTDPSTRPDGSAVQAGDMYFNSSSGLWKRYSGSTWQASDINTANLAASGGAALIGFTGGLTNESTSTVQAVLRNLAIDATRFGCVGDGITDDTVNFRNWIAAAGANASLLLPAGKTFLLSGECQLLQGQSLYGYGAKVKRIGEKKSNTSTAISIGAGPTAITVADGTQFTVGRTVTVYNGSSYDPNTHNVQSVVGNIVTVNGAFTVAFPSGGTLVTVGELITSTATDVKVLGLEVDGNRSNNTSLAKWDVHCGIFLSGDRSVVQHCYIHDEVSEGIELGGVGSQARDNWVVNCGGNGIHFSGTTGAKALGNTVINVNLLGTAPGHADGAIIFSDSTGYSIIDGNYIDTAISAFGSIDTDGNSSVTISGNIVRNCTTYAVEGVTPSGTRAGKVTIVNNEFYDSVAITLNSTAGSLDPAQCPYDWIISNNYLENTRIVLTRATNIKVHDNEIRWVANTTQALIDIGACTQIKVHDNTCEGGLYGIAMSGNFLKVHSNTCRNNYARGIMQGSAGTSVSIHNNDVLVESSYTTNGTYYGIVLQNGTSVKCNNLNIQVSAGSHGIYCPNGGASATGGIVTENIVRSAGMTSSIRCDGGTQNNYVKRNQVQQSISNAGGGSNFVSDNDTITA